MRLGLLASIAWLVTLTEPLFEIFGKSFSGRDLIMLGGGLFLLFKATMELHERLEGRMQQHSGSKAYARFWPVVAQIIVLDAVFSARCGDHRRRHGRTPAGDDDRRGHLDDPDAAGKQAAHRIRQRACRR
ncbi:hypothetical protein SSTU70S_04112 [Stutzerimonas stutzeri]